MARTSGISIDNIIRETVESVIARAMASISRTIRDAVDAEVKGRANDRAQPRQARADRRRRGGRSRPRQEITTWVADRNARRVPTFVIEATGFDTKKKIVARFGDGATFKKGAPLPRAKGEHAGAPQSPADTSGKAGQEVTAKPPIIRKAAAK
jgi:hypothetical protein